LVAGNVRFGLFVYNEIPANAVAIACWSWARHHLTRPFLCARATAKWHRILFLVSLFS
jgi:hypothetical protein